MTILSPQHMTILTNTVYIANRSMVSFKSNINIKCIYLFLCLSCTLHIALTMDLSVLKFYRNRILIVIVIVIFYSNRKILISLSFRQHASLALHMSYKQPLSALEEISCHTTHHSKLNPPTSCSGSHSSLTSSTCTHSVTKICKFPHCFRFIT